MRYAATLLFVAACGKGGESKVTDKSAAAVKLAKPEDARIIAQELAKAMTACDQGQLSGFLDLPYLASRAGGTGAFLQEASKLHLECDTPVTAYTASVVDRPGTAKPLIRWRQGMGCDGKFGYVELTVEAASPAPRIADLETPLDPQSMVKSLRNIQSLSSADQPGMLSDVFFAPFTGVDVGARSIQQLDMSAHKIGAKMRPEDLAQAISRGFVEHDYGAVQVAVSAVAKLVGEDAQLASVRVAASLGAGEAPYAQQVARDATTKWPDDIDAWCVRFEAERAAGDSAAMAEAKQTLEQKFKVRR
jgi:hypothetical protein